MQLVFIKVANIYEITALLPLFMKWTDQINVGTYLKDPLLKRANECIKLSAPFYGQVF